MLNFNGRNSDGYTILLCLIRLFALIGQLGKIAPLDIVRTYFNPNEITPNKQNAEVVIEDFFVFNESGSAFLDNHVNYAEELVLDHDQNFLSFDLSSLSYFKSDQNQYRYRLQPLNDEWIDMKNRNFISLNGLSPGNYTLSIQASNNDKVWGHKIKSINIHIKQPLYARWYAWLFYILVIASLIYTYYRMRINHITNLALAREDERTKIRERSARDFHDEVGSLVTKLSLLNQYLLSDTPEEEKENIIANKI